MLNAELTPTALAELVGVDAKTVSRWLVEDRVPYPVTRIKIAHALSQQESYLWPALVEHSPSSVAALGDLENVWPTRTAISSDQWHELFSRATRQVDILVYAGDFLIEILDFFEVVAAKAARGVSVRMLIGDPASCVIQHRVQELSEPSLPDRCRMMARQMSDLARARGVAMRVHATILYANQFRFDNIQLVNACAFGVRDAASPVYSYRATVGSQLFDFHAEAFERVWRISDRSDSPT